MTVIKRMKHKKKDGSIIEADIGALAKNIEEDDDHRFVTDNEKKTWNEKLSKDGDMAESTVSSLEETQETFPKPKAGDKQKTLWGKIVKWQQDCLTKFGNYVLMSMLTNQHLNSTNNIPTSALVYLMQQAIQQNQSDINVLNTNLGDTNKLNGTVVDILFKKVNQMIGFVTDANYHTSFGSYIAIANGWDSNIANFPSEFKNTFGILIQAKIDISTDVYVQALLFKNGNIKVRQYENFNWSPWE